MTSNPKTKPEEQVTVDDETPDDPKSRGTHTRGIGLRVGRRRRRRHRHVHLAGPWDDP